MCPAACKAAGLAPTLTAPLLVHQVRQGTGPDARRTVVMLHGQGGDEHAMWVFARTVPREWLVVAARGPEAEPSGGWSWRAPREATLETGTGRSAAPADARAPSAAEAGVDLPSLARFAPSVDRLADFVASLPQAYDADPGATYLLGFSQGAAAAYALALMRPGLTTAIAGLFGFMPEADGRVFASRPLLGVKVWSAYGESDPYIPLEAALGAVDRLASAGAAVESHAYPGGHKLPRSGLRDLAAWWRTL